MEKLTQKEIVLLIVLVKAHEDIIDFLRGFRKMTKYDKEKKEYYNNIIKKLNILSAGESLNK